MSFSAKSYGNILGANDKVNVAIIGLGRRLGAFIPPLSDKNSNVSLSYLATFKFDDNKTIMWDGKSRNNYNMYGSDRGTIIFGTKGSVFVNRGLYRLFDIDGKLIREVQSAGEEGSTGLGGGGDMSSQHVVNFFDSIRGKVTQRSPIDEGAKSTLLCHLANISSRIGENFDCDTTNGHIYNRKGMALWSREYEKGWEPKI